MIKLLMLIIMGLGMTLLKLLLGLRDLASRAVLIPCRELVSGALRWCHDTSLVAPTLRLVRYILL